MNFKFSVYSKFDFENYLQKNSVRSIIPGTTHADIVLHLTGIQAVR